MKNFYITISAYIFFIIIILFGTPRSANHEITAKSIWSVPSNARTEMMQNCPYKLGPMQFTQCITKIMQAYNANEAAIDFTTLLQGQGFMSDFRNTGIVDVARAAIIGADRSDEFYLVNGKPNPINVDDPAILNQLSNALAANGQYQTIKADHPDVLLWGGNHDFPTVIKNKNGTLRFVFTYPLKKGCVACETIGQANIAFDFNSTGLFLGPQLVAVSSK